MWNQFRSDIKEYRMKKNLTQKQLANVVGVSQVQISHIERGARDIKPELLDKICDALDLDYTVSLKEKKEDSRQTVLEMNEKRENSLIIETYRSKDRICKRERKTERLQLLMRPSTKEAIMIYAEQQNSSLNDVVHSLMDAFLVAQNDGESICEYKGVLFVPNDDNSQKENKTGRIQLLLKPSTKNKIKEVAYLNDTSVNDIVQKLVDGFLLSIENINKNHV